MGLFDLYAEAERERQQEEERRLTQGFGLPNRPLGQDIERLQQGYGKQAVEEAYGPGELAVDVLPASAAVKGAKLFAKGMGAFARPTRLEPAAQGLRGAMEGWIRTAPSGALDTMKALQRMEPEAADFALRSAHEFRVRPGTAKDFEGDLATSGGWAQRLYDPTNRYITGTEIVVNPTVDKVNIPGITQHEIGHGVQRASGHEYKGLDPGIAEFTPFMRQWHEKSPSYGTAEKIEAEIAANALAGPYERSRWQVNILDPTRFQEYKEKNFPKLVADQMFIVDPALEGGKAGEKMAFGDWFAKMKNTEKFKLMDEFDKMYFGWKKGKAFQGRPELQAMVQKKFDDELARRLDAYAEIGPPVKGEYVPRPPSAFAEKQAAPKPMQELQDLLTSLGPASPKVKTDLSGLSEADRPWVGVQSFKRTGGPREMPKSYASPDVYVAREGGKLEKEMAPNLDMPDDIANYVMKKYTTMHTDNPIVKEGKRRNFDTFMKWWGGADDQARRDYIKLIRSQEEEAVAAAPKPAPMSQEDVINNILAQMLPEERENAIKKLGKNAPAWTFKKGAGETMLKQNRGLRSK